MEKCKTCANGYPSVSCTNCGTGFRNYVKIGHTIEDYIRKATKQTEELQAYKDTGLTPEQVEDMKKSLKQYDEDRIATQQECGSVCEDAIEMHQQIEAQQQEIDILNMGIAELRESNQALKDYAENADADKDEQAGRIMRMDYLLRRTLPILEATNNQQELIEAIDALLGGAEG